ncbi:MAG: SOS response-associated peptidase family protein [Pseudomonadota bacterium]
MCNHYRNDPEAMKHLPTWREYIAWDLPRRPDALEPKADVWPKYPAMIVRDEAGSRIADVMSWGVPTTIPGKRPGTSVQRRVTNVRNLASPFWRSMLARPMQRCLVPFSTFAEPVIGGGRSEHWFSVPSEPVAAFAGIWRPSTEGDVFAFLTCEPNPLVAPLHPKAMPVVLHPSDYDRWLDAEWDDACALVTPFPSQLMAVA